MDKEAQGQIANLLQEDMDKGLLGCGTTGRILDIFYELGYRKLPKDKPPLLSGKEMQNIRFGRPSPDAPRLPGYVMAVAEAQRESDIKFYGGE